jgi:hypothetical protein
MLIFLDTEFSDFTDMELLSIGMITCDGKHQLYLQRNDYNYGLCSTFVKTDIIPLMDKIGNHIVGYCELQYRVKTWLKTLPYDEVEIVVDYPGDWMLLRELWTFGEALPENLKGGLMLYNLEGVRSDLLSDGITLFWRENPNFKQHRADHDAAANRAGYLHCLEQLY